MTTFDEAWAIAEPIPGWLTREQGGMLWDAARRLPPGAHIVEIGSHQGRSTVVLGCAARDLGLRLTAIDPFVDGRLFGGDPTRGKFEKNVAAAGLADVVDLVVEYSTRLRPRWTERFHLLYVDGKHDYWTFTDDLRWSEHLVDGADVIVHDCFSSIGVTSGVLATVLPGRRYTYVERAGSLARFQLRRPSAADRARILRQLPWFLRNVGIKILLRLRLHPVARALGHTGHYDPY
jgi:predicted O-methyltransferase YrrM